MSIRYHGLFQMLLLLLLLFYYYYYYYYYYNQNYNKIIECDGLSAARFEH